MYGLEARRSNPVPGDKARVRGEAFLALRKWDLGVSGEPTAAVSPCGRRALAQVIPTLD